MDPGFTASQLCVCRLHGDSTLFSSALAHQVVYDGARLMLDFVVSMAQHYLLSFGGGVVEECRGALRLLGMC